MSPKTQNGENNFQCFSTLFEMKVTIGYKTRILSAYQAQLPNINRYQYGVGLTFAGFLLCGYPGNGGSKLPLLKVDLAHQRHFSKNKILGECELIVTKRLLGTGK